MAIQTNISKMEKIRAILAREVTPFCARVTIEDHEFIIVPHTEKIGSVSVTRYNLQLEDEWAEGMTMSGLAALISTKV